MSAIEKLLGSLLFRGVELWPEGESLRIRAANAVVSPDELSFLRQNKSAILRLLPEFVFCAPLSHGQRALWLVQQSDPGSCAYILGLSLQIQGTVNPAALREALQGLVNRHAVLRTCVATSRGVPEQAIRGYQTVCLDRVNAAGLNQAQLMRRMSTAQRPIDPEQGPIFRATLFTRSPEDCALQLDIHHLAADGWCFPTMLDELLQLYEASNPLPPLKRTYLQFAQWQSERLAAQGERLSSYWKQALTGAPFTLSLPLDFVRPAVQTFRGADVAFSIEPGLTERIKGVGRSCGATPYMTLAAAFQVLLHRYSGQEDILVGSPAAGRDSEEFSETAGYMVNPIVLRSRLSRHDSPDFTTFLKQTRRTVLEALEHQDYPFPLLVQDMLTERDPSRSPIFQVMFVYQGGQGRTGRIGRLLSGETIEVSGLKLSLIHLPATTSEFDLTLEIEERQDRLDGKLRYNTDLFQPGTIERMAEHFQTLLEGIADAPSQRVADLPLLTAAERDRILVDWNRTALDYPRHLAVHRFFEKQTQLTPDATAVIHGHSAVTYRQLNQRANQLARYLRYLGAGPETRIGICVNRSIDMIVAMLATLKAGSAYLALDPAYPAARLAFILQDAAAPILLTSSDLSDRLPATAGAVVRLDRLQQEIALESTIDPDWEVLPEQLAYVLYTSGSTGKPKGVALEHRNAVALVAWAQSEFPPEMLAGTLATTSICFDLSVFEIFVPLSCGGCVILAENALALPELAARDRVTLINTVPSAIRQLLDRGPLPSAVRVVNLAGETLSESLVQDIHRQGTVQKVYNLYGPTEDTTYSTFCVAGKNAAADPPIGKPLANSQCYILDAAFQPVPVGVTGEIYLAGDGLARGYLHRPGLTAERFLPNPFGPGRLYKSGDLGRYRDNGQIEFVGRIDRQVKLRGFRINLGEIETVLSQHPGIERAVVEVNTTGERLTAYWIGRQAGGADEQELRSHLAKSLPGYMIPSFFVRLQSFPLTPNGKLDRKALPAPEARTVEAQRFEDPRSPMETELAGIWREVLNLERVARDDNFFHLGGHSLLAFQVVSRLRETCKIEIPLRSVFEAPILHDMAGYLDTILLAHRLRVSTRGLNSMHQTTGRI